MEKPPLVSVLVPTLHSGATLARCLESVQKQTYRPIEILVIDRGSKDATADIAKARGARVFVISASERTEQLNYGAKKADGKYLYRVDSDFVLEPGVVEEAVRACEEGGYDAICVHNTSDATVSFWASVRKFERDMYLDDDLNIAARFVKKEAFERIGGFDTQMVAGEDYDLHNRLLASGYKIGRIGAQELHLGEPKTLVEVAAKHYYYGQTLPRFVDKNGRLGWRQLSPLRPAFFKNISKFIQSPLLAAGFFIYQFVRYAAGGLGYAKGLADSTANRPSAGADGKIKEEKRS